MANPETRLTYTTGKGTFSVLPRHRGSALGFLAIGLTWVATSHSSPGPADPAAVRFTEGQIHGFLTLKTLDGALIADGDETQVSHGDRVTTQLVFHFKDGSLQDETTVFSQRGHFHLLTDRLIQKGPTFKHPMEIAVDGATGVVTVHAQDEKGKEKVETATLKMPPDLANGMVPVLLMNLAAGAQSTSASMVVAAPKPTLVTLDIAKEGEDSFRTGGAPHKAIRYDIKVEIPGVRGVIAPLVGKQPPDTHVWILSGSSPAFVKSEGPACEGCPIWRTELASPVWPESGTETTSSKKQR
jgi:hypothetical protein